MSSRAVKIRVASARPEPRQDRRHCAMPSTRRRASRCVDCRSTASFGDQQGVIAMRSRQLNRCRRHRWSSLVLAVFAWRLFSPGPMAFAGGSTVALADYHAGDPTGVPADLAEADIVKRGEYLARAADCVVCHTAPGRNGLCRRVGVSPTVRHDLFANITAR